MFSYNVWPLMTFPSLFVGTIAEAAGIATLTWAVTTRRVALVNGMMGLAGAGTGLHLIPNTLHAAGIWPDKLAAAMSVMDFALPFGGTLALAIMGAVFNNKMTSVKGLDLFRVHNTESLHSISQLPRQAQDVIRNAGKKVIMWAFVSITPLMVLSVLAASSLGNVWIGSRKAKKVVGEDKLAPSAVLHTSYLMAIANAFDPRYFIQPVPPANSIS